MSDLGALLVEVSGRRVELGATKQAALLARLLVSLRLAVSAEALVDAAWGPDARTGRDDRAAGSVGAPTSEEPTEAGSA